MWDLVWIWGFLELGFCWHSSFHTVLLGKLPKRAWPRRPAPSQRTSWALAGWCPSRSSRARKPCRHWVKSGQACGGRLPPGSRPLTPGLLGLCPHLPCLTDLCGFSLLWQLGLTQLGCTALISHFCFYSCPERSTHPINTSGRTLLESGCQQAWGRSLGVCLSSQALGTLLARQRDDWLLAASWSIRTSAYNCTPQCCFYCELLLFIYLHMYFLLLGCAV